MIRARTLTTASAAVAALLVLPLRSDGGAPCDNVTTSLAASINNPVSGDEKFFTLPQGPSNLMFLVDTSGSMDNLPQCGDASNWGDSSALTTCKFPTFAAVAAPGAAGVVNADGTCDVASNANLSWMTTFVPTANLVDPGHGTASSGLVDAPAWGTGCTGNNCLFQPTAVYGYGSWNETSATPTSNPCTITFTYSDYNCANPNSPQSVTKTFTGTLPNCSACLTDANAKGFYFYKNWTAAYTVNKVSSGWSGTTCSGGTTVQTKSGGGTSKVLFSGGWLNANPPKFMSARKVIKDVAWIDPAQTQPSDQLRIGLTYVSTAITNNAAIIVPLGPSAANSYPVNPAAFVSARQLVLDALNHRNWPATLPQLANGGTPMASGLFRVGQYFSNPGTYTTNFGSSTWELSAFAPTSAGVMQAPWVNGSTTTICWSCQKSAVIIVTDGSPNSEITFPATIQSWDDAVYKSAANCGPGTSCSSSPASLCCSPSDSSSNPPSRMPRIGDYLHNTDLHLNDLNGPQTLMVSAVSFNLPLGNARTILQATANMSGGSYNNASDGQELAAAVATAVAQISNTSTSFGAPAATALSTVHSNDTKAFVTRFRPNQKATWEGHLFQWMLFDEAAAGCDPTKKFDGGDATQLVQCRGKTVHSNFNGDTTPQGYNLCSGSFLVDADCDEVSEDQNTGNWYKKGSGNTPARKFWDAGEVLSTPGTTGYRTAAEHADAGNIAPLTTYAPGQTPRNLWTALPDGTMYELETKNAAVLAPYMNLDWQWCQTMMALAKVCGGSGQPACPTQATFTADVQKACAQQVILFARGWDVMDQDSDGCAGPMSNTATGAMTNLTASGTGSCIIATSGATRYTGEERDRANDALAAASSTTAPSFYKLGDVFHSAPALAHPPTSEALCRLGVDSQCVRTLFGFTSNQKYLTKYQTALDTYSGCKSDTVDAYRRWRYESRDRESAVIVGSNDGFLHAFDAGGSDTATGTPDVDCVYPVRKDGTGEELWAFLPPDLLPRLRDTMFNHQYMVDGNVMLRDVWVDGLPGGSLDGKKQKTEFRTIAVLTERSGGTQFTALDVTSSFDTNAANRPRPAMLWTFPPPRSADAQFMGQSWSDFSPRPPPIGPVRLVPNAQDRDPDGKGWVEKWVVMINGGYDPTLNRGRAVWMLDAWTGKAVWRFTDTDFKTNVLNAPGNVNTGMFPVPAAVALVDLGDPTLTPLDSDNFFDTATWGDMGGNLWVARFWDPGARDPGTGLVTNWRAARTFEQSRQASDAQLATNRTEFFYMTSNVYEPQKRALRTMIGSGNREQILEQGQGCGPDNLFSCCQAGCSVTSTTRLDYGVCNSSGSFSCSAGQMTSGALAQGCGAAGATACTGGALNQFVSSSGYALNCGGTALSSVSASATCDANGLCSVASVGTGHDVVPPNAGTCSQRARFFGVWAYGGLGVSQKAFSTDPTQDWSSARTFDQNRFTDTPNFAGCAFTGRGNCSLVDTTQAVVSASGATSCATGGAASNCQANVSDPGWFYQYNTSPGPCPTRAACSGSCTNEKSASGATVVNSCATWNSFLPVGSAQSGSNPCATTGTATQTAIAYASNYVSGTPDATCAQDIDANYVYRGIQRNTIAPPSSPMVHLGVSSRGQVYYSTLQMNPGQAPSNTGLGSRDLASQLYWLEVSRTAHNCRHVSSQNCD